MDSKQKLVEATIDLVCEYGIVGASTAKIAEKAGVATGTLFHHFATKQDLLIFVHIEVQKRKMASFHGHIEDCNMDLEQKAKMFVESATEYWVSHPRELDFTRQLLNSPYYSDSAKKEEEALHKKGRAMIERDMAEGRIRQMDVDFLMSFFQSHVLAIAGFVLNARSQKEKQRYLEEGYLFIWNAIKP